MDMHAAGAICREGTFTCMRIPNQEYPRGFTSSPWMLKSWGRSLVSLCVWMAGQTPSFQERRDDTHYITEVLGRHLSRTRRQAEAASCDQFGNQLQRRFTLLLAKSTQVANQFRN